MQDAKADKDKTQSEIVDVGLVRVTTSQTLSEQVSKVVRQLNKLLVQSCHELHMAAIECRLVWQMIHALHATRRAVRQSKRDELIAVESI